MTINFKIILIFALFLCIFLKKNRILGGNNKDSDKQKKFKTVLEDMKTILDKNNQKFFLACGTLLGCIRDQKFIEHDLDIDLGIFSDQYDKTIENKILNSDKFSSVHRLGELNKNYEISFKHINGVKIDIFLHYKIEKNIYYGASFYGLCDKKPEKYCKWKFKIDDLINYTFFDKTYLIPKNYKEYLKDRYGEDWKTPKNYTYNEGLNGLYKNLMGGKNKYDLDGYRINKNLCNQNTKRCDYPYTKNTKITSFRCCKDNLIELLYYVVKILDEHKIDYFIDYGTLLGCMRDNSFIKWDTDIDISIINNKNIDNIFNIISKNKKGYYFRKDSSILYILNFSKTNLLHIDFYIRNKKNNSFYNMYQNTKDSTHNISTEDLYPLKQRKFENLNVKIPNNSLKYLENVYGNNCLKEIKTKDKYTLFHS